MNKWADYVNAQTGEVVKSLPEGAKKVDFELGKHKLPNWASAPKEPNKWLQLALAGGGGLLAHSLVSSMLDNDDEEDAKKESVWRKLLRIIAPLGAGVAGAYGGYLLGKEAQYNANPQKRPAGLYYDTDTAEAGLKANGESILATPFMAAGAGGLGVSAYNGVNWARSELAAKQLEKTLKDLDVATAAPAGGPNARAAAVEPRVKQLYENLAKREATPKGNASAAKDMAAISKAERFANGGASAAPRTASSAIKAEALASEAKKLTAASRAHPYAKRFAKGSLVAGLGSLGIGWLLDRAAANNRAAAEAMKRPEE